jgi:hypothetical protein
MLDVAKHLEAGGTELQDRAEFFWVASALVLVVADGAGGMSGGAEAAEFVVQFVKRSISHGSLYPDRIATTALASAPAEAAKNLAGLVRYASGRLPDDLAILVARQT